MQGLNSQRGDQVTYSSDRASQAPLTLFYNYKLKIRLGFHQGPNNSIGPTLYGYFHSLPDNFHFLP